MDISLFGFNPEQEHRTETPKQLRAEWRLVPRLIVVPLSSHEIDGVRKEKERLTAAAKHQWRDTQKKAAADDPTSTLRLVPKSYERDVWFQG